MIVSHENSRFTSCCLSADGRWRVVREQEIDRLPRWLESGMRAVDTPGGRAIQFAQYRDLMGRLQPCDPAKYGVAWSMVLSASESFEVLGLVIADPSDGRGLEAIGHFARRYNLPLAAFMACVRELRGAKTDCPLLLTVFDQFFAVRPYGLDDYWLIAEGIVGAYFLGPPRANRRSCCTDLPDEVSIGNGRGRLASAKSCEDFFPGMRFRRVFDDL